MQSLFHVHYKLYFLCECSNEPQKLHFALHDGYSIKKSREFIARYGPYLRTMLRVVQMLLTLEDIGTSSLEYASTFVGERPRSFLQSSINLYHMKQKIEFVEKLLNKTDSNLACVASSMLQQVESQEISLQTTDLQELENYLEFVDNRHSLGNLYRLMTIDGHVRWVCLEHYHAISFNNKMSQYIGQLEAMGGQFNQENNEAILTQANLTSKNIKMVCKALTNGFNIVKLMFQKCKISEDDLDILLDIIINRSSIRCLIMTAIDVCSWFRISKYTCEYIRIDFNNQSFKIRFNDQYQNGNIQMFIRILLQNKIHRTLDFSACDILGHEKELQHYLDINKMLTGLIVHCSNNIDILNAISTIKIKTLHLNHSLRLPSTSSHFCEMLKKNQTLIEINIMDSIGFKDEAFITNLLCTLRKHRSIKHLSLHVCDVRPSNQKEICLMDSLLNDKFISRLCLSQSIISHELTQAFVHASQEVRSLTHLEFYESQINADDVSELQALCNNEALIHLTFSEQPRWHLAPKETAEWFKTSKSSVKKSNITNKYEDITRGRLYSRIFVVVLTR